MFSVFRVVLILSVIGTLIALVLLIIKPLTRRHFSPRWQYYIWIAVLVAMIFPIPARQTPKAGNVSPPSFVMPIPIDTHIEIASGEEPYEGMHDNIKWREPVSLLWAAGAAIYILSAFIGYWRFLVGKKRISRKSDIDLSAAAAKVGVKKAPRVRICGDNTSPMLVGIIKPVIYLPREEIDDGLEYVLMHELMHYKRHDLLYKWAALVINGIHWFNPIAYIVSKNINEQCEISCDIAVTHNMNETEKNKYMQTILDLLRP